MTTYIIICCLVAIISSTTPEDIDRVINNLIKEEE